MAQLFEMIADHVDLFGNQGGCFICSDDCDCKLLEGLYFLIIPEHSLVLDHLMPLYRYEISSNLYSIRYLTTGTNQYLLVGNYYGLPVRRRRIKCAILTF